MKIKFHSGHIKMLNEILNDNNLRNYIAKKRTEQIGENTDVTNQGVLRVCNRLIKKGLYFSQNIPMLNSYRTFYLEYKCKK